ncbi:MAG TPA: S-methyl-5'-thioadenosine phosphorylase [Ktedonobacterales bacterium]|nr:S-methyl-5'-thioadenosine phosphorylase [Ktedonobacterales bacterium]
MTTRKARLGVIGGSGLYAMPGLTAVEQVEVSTPFGAPSDALTLGDLDGMSVAFLPRHGRGHRLNPSEVPSRANIFALKSLGVERVISVSAVGSLREDIAPLHLVIPDQLVDRTKARPSTFFEGGVVAHVGFAEPFCPDMSGRLADAMTVLGDITFHRGGSYVCIEGPQFSTKAESRIYRQWGCDIVGMTALPEAKLAREAQLCYATIACVTDYDVWHESEQPVTVEMVVANLTRNVANAQRIIRHVAQSLAAGGDDSACGCGAALRDALMTNPAHLTPELRARFGLLLGEDD